MTFNVLVQDVSSATKFVTKKVEADFFRVDENSGNLLLYNKAENNALSMVAAFVNWSSIERG